MVLEHLIQVDGELDIGTPHDVLDLEMLELDMVSQFLVFSISCIFWETFHYLDDPGIFPGSNATLVFGLGSGAHHLPRSEHQGRGLGLPQPHDDRRESPGVVLGVSGLQGNVLQVQGAVQVDCGYDVPTVRPGLSTEIQRKVMKKGTGAWGVLGSAGAGEGASRARC